MQVNSFIIPQNPGYFFFRLSFFSQIIYCFIRDKNSLTLIKDMKTKDSWSLLILLRGINSEGARDNEQFVKCQAEAPEKSRKLKKVRGHTKNKLHRMFDFPQGDKCLWEYLLVDEILTLQ